MTCGAADPWRADAVDERRVEPARHVATWAKTMVRETLELDECNWRNVTRMTLFLKVRLALVASELGTFLAELMVPRGRMTGSLIYENILSWLLGQDKTPAFLTCRQVLSFLSANTLS